MADPGEKRGNDKPASGTATQAGDGVPDVLDDPVERRRLMRKYGYTEADLRTKAKRDLFYEAVRKEYTRKEASKAYDKVYVNDEATVREVIGDSGFSMELIKQYPELRDLFRRLSDMLARGKITEKELPFKFKELMGETEFGKRTTTAITADLDRYKKNNKQNWNQRVQKVVDRITYFLQTEEGKGLAMDPAASQELATALIYAGEEQDAMALARRVREWVKANRAPENPEEPAAFVPGGDRAKYTNQLATWLSANGLVVSAGEVAKYVDSILDGSSDIEDIKQWFRTNRLSVDYSGFADEFARGIDASDIALNYRSIMADLLEKNVEDIDFSDPMVQRAMQNRGDDGKAKPLTRYEFEQQVRGSEDWQKTDNAMSVYTDIGEGILRSFGFRG